MEGAQRATLRKLAVNLNLVEASAKSFSISREALIEKLKEVVPDIENMTEPEALAMIADGAAPAAKKNTVTTPSKPSAPAPKVAAPASKPGPKPKAAPEPEPEPEEPVEEAQAPAPRGKPGPKPRVAAPAAQEDPAPSKPGPKPGIKPGLKPSAAPTRQEEPAQTKQSVPEVIAADVDLTPVIERVDAVGLLVDKVVKGSAAGEKSIAALQSDVTKLKEQIGAILGYLTWQYNSQAEEEVSSLTDINWG